MFGQVRRSRRSRRAAVLGSLAILLALGTATPGAAAVTESAGARATVSGGAVIASETQEWELRLASGPVTSVYGDFWGIDFFADSLFSNPTRVVEIPGLLTSGASEAVVITNTRDPNHVSDNYAYLNTPMTIPPIDVGSYEFIITIRVQQGDTAYVGTLSTPAKLTIEPATLRVDARVQQDPNNPVVTVISAALSGEYIDRWGWTSTDPTLEPGYARVPGGTWRIVVTDDEGTTLLDESIVRANGAVPSATLALTDLPQDTTLSASVTFTLDASSAGNFTLTQSQPFGFTTPAEARPILVVDDESLDETVAVADAGPTMPVGLIGLAGLIAVGLATTVVFQVVRMRRGALPASAPGDAPDSAPADPVEVTS